MPEMIPLGWFHTILGIGALMSGFYTLIKYRVVSDDGHVISYTYLSHHIMLHHAM